MTDEFTSIEPDIIFYEVWGYPAGSNEAEDSGWLALDKEATEEHAKAMNHEYPNLRCFVVAKKSQDLTPEQTKKILDQHQRTLSVLE